MEQYSGNPMESIEGPRLQSGTHINLESSNFPKKRPRKSRSKGLRTRNGCITCRKRHKKCDEVLPRCTNCCIADRTCIWPDHLSQTEPSSRILSPRQTEPEIANDASESFFQPHPDPHEAYLPQISDHISQHSPYSPSNTVTSDLLSADLASVRWLDLLASDALQANKGFSRAPSPSGDPPTVPILTGAPDSSGAGGTIIPSDQGLGSERRSWQLDKEIVLKDSEVVIFRNFIDRAALWLDVFDPHMHFSTYATRLALRNIGLMKAILALSAQHLSRQNQIDRASNAFADPSLAVQYYYETLHYVQTALQYNSYAHSEEILATALVISTYEMLDESESGWQRHLKGVFWIQRSQNVDGESGGIRQAVWWAWLRQDIWAAFRERRRCFSFWKPVKDLSELSQHELTERVTYLFSQAVNYSADRNDSSEAGRGEAADNLLAMLERWKSFLGPNFEPLPSVKSDSIFQPIWIHPPKYGAALQIYYFARIMITLHRPSLPGFNAYLKSQKCLSEAVAVICGIAMELKDEGCQIASSQCLYGAGLCVQEPAQQNQIISLIDACEERTGWPMSTMKEDLYKEWKKLHAEG